jgi:hypothetical protein
MLVVRAAVLIDDVEIARSEVDHHAVDVVLVERALVVRTVDRGQDADAIVIHLHARIGCGLGGKNAQANSGYGNLGFQ